MLLVILAALASATPDAAAAATTTAPNTPPPAAAKAKGDVVCKTLEVTGSRFPKKVCYSKAEAEAQKQIDQEHLRESQSGGLIRGN